MNPSILRQKLGRHLFQNCFTNNPHRTRSSNAILFASSLTFVTALSYASPFNRKNKAKCCGIVGYIGPKEAEPILVEGVRILQNRGYDSCGLSTVSSNGKTNEIVTTKYASKGTTSDCINILCKEAPERHRGHKLGIAHTRWATHGGKTNTNAHPHQDYLDRISLVHNGTIENYAILKDELKQKKISFRSDTDTEVVANLIGWHLDEGKDIEEAVSATVESLQGTWGLAVIHKDYPDQIILARNGSPLLVGCSSSSEVFVASEPSALARHTNQFLSLQDGEICVVSSRGIDHLINSRPMQKIHIENVEVSPDPFEHWTLKEISEQPQSLARALNYGGRIDPVGNRVKLGGLDINTESMLEIKHLILAGCGTSLYAAMYGERLMQYLGCFESARAIDASELDAGCFTPTGGGILLMSQSGETLDTIRACQLAEAQNIRKLSVVNVVGSLLARMTNCGVYLNAGREVAVASTKAFSSQVAVLSLIGTWFAQNALNEVMVCSLDDRFPLCHRASADSDCQTVTYCTPVKSYSPQLTTQTCVCATSTPSVAEESKSCDSGPTCNGNNGQNSNSNYNNDSRKGKTKVTTTTESSSAAPKMLPDIPNGVDLNTLTSSSQTLLGTPTVHNSNNLKFSRHRYLAPTLKPHQDRCQLLMDAIHRLPVCAGMTLNSRDKCREIAHKIKDAKTLFILGKGFAHPVALEAALKIKEISYVHAEGFPGGALKHGPFALLDEAEKTPVILIIPSDEHTTLMINAAEQVKARGARLIGIVDNKKTLEGMADDIIVVPNNGPLTALMCVFPLQLIAYEIAVAKGINPDKPRGLAKTVTVS